MSIGAFTNAILRNGVTLVGSAAVTGGVVLYLGKNYNYLVAKKNGAETARFELAFCGAASLLFASLAYGLGGSLGNHFFNTANKWTALKTLGQISTQVSFGTLLSGVAALVGKTFVDPQFKEDAKIASEQEEREQQEWLRVAPRLRDDVHYASMGEGGSFKSMGKSNKRPIEEAYDSFPTPFDFHQQGDQSASFSDKE